MARYFISICNGTGTVHCQHLGSVRMGKSSERLDGAPYPVLFDCHNHPLGHGTPPERKSRLHRIHQWRRLVVNGPQRSGWSNYSYLLFAWCARIHPSIQFLTDNYQAPMQLLILPKKSETQADMFPFQFSGVTSPTV